MLNAAAFAVSTLRPTVLSRAHPATRLAGLGLGLASAMMLPPPGLAGLLAGLALALAATGLAPARQLAALRPWLPVAALVLAVHTLTTVAAAPLGHPSWPGLWAGVRALARVAASIGLLGLYLRIASLDDLISATGWWLAPLARLGVPVADFGLVLAVALGTAPLVLGEGRRSEMVLRMRRAVTPAANAGPGAEPVRRRALVRLWQQTMDRARLVVPMIETLSRRAEALTLSLRRRRPRPGVLGRLPVPEGLGLALWLGLLVWRPW